MTREMNDGKEPSPWMLIKKSTACMLQSSRLWAQTVLPSFLPSIGGGIVYMAILSGSQNAGMVLKVSSATPVFGPLLGGVAVGAASAASGQISSFVKRKQASDDGCFVSESFGEEVILHSLLGMMAFKALGGSFRCLMPSNLVHRGSLAKVSLPARLGKAYVGVAEKPIIADMFRRFGCHHCGAKTGNAIADHIPPTAAIYGSGWAKSANSSKQASNSTPAVNSQSASSNEWSSGPLGRRKAFQVPQRLYPQCQDCSLKQSVAVRLKRKTLVKYDAGLTPQPFQLGGFFVGAFHFDSGAALKEMRLPFTFDTVGSFGRRTASQCLSLYVNLVNKWRSKSIEMEGSPNSAEKVRRIREELATGGQQMLDAVEAQAAELRNVESATRSRLRACQLGSTDDMMCATMMEDLQKIAAQKQQLKLDSVWLQQNLRK